MSPSQPAVSPEVPTPWGEVFLAALPAALHALYFLGRLHPDEVFQSLEPALNRTFGFGIMAWEWSQGLRNHAVPILFSWFLKAASALGIEDVWGRRAVLELPQLALHTAMLGAVWRFAARRVGPTLARPVLWLTAFYAPVLWFGGRTMSESFSVAFLVWALERLDDEGAGGGRAPLTAGVLLGLAVVTRYGSVAVVLPALLWLLMRRRFRALSWTCAGGLVVALLLGALDRYTWGRWFHSFFAYTEFNVLSGRSAEQFGALPPWFYFQRLAIAPWAVLGLLLSAKRPALERAWLFVFCAVGYFVILSATPHKEDRFLYPTLVLLSVAGAPAFVAWAWEQRATWKVRGWTVVALAAGGLFFVIHSPWAPSRTEQFQLEVKASRGATGLVMLNEGLWGSGGFFYLGQNLPWCTCDFPQQDCFRGGMADPRVNRGLYWANSPEDPRNAEARAAFEAAGFHLAEQRGPASLFVR